MSSQKGINVIVQNLHNTISDSSLGKLFDAFGIVVSAKVMTTPDGKSRGFGFVFFADQDCGQKAIKEMDGKQFLGKKLYVGVAKKKSEREQELKQKFEQTTGGNLIIQNLVANINDECLRKIFAPFGKVTSAKVMTESNGKSKGFGFVAYENLQSAENAIKEMNGKEIFGKNLFVGKAQRRAEREQELKRRFEQLTNGSRGLGSNLIVQNLDEAIDDDRLHEEFSPFGEITSAKVMLTDDGKSKGFGFVAYKDPKCAEKAIQEMNSKELCGKVLYVGRAQKKAERQQELKHRFKELENKHISGHLGKNLYIGNLSEKIDDERLKKEFSSFGTITSAKVMLEGGRSKGFGFVCFSSPAEAARALCKMNGKTLENKELYVSLSQSKDERNSIKCLQKMVAMRQLANTYRQQLSGVLSYPSPAVPVSFAQRFSGPMHVPQLRSPQSPSQLQGVLYGRTAAVAVCPGPQWPYMTHQQPAIYQPGSKQIVVPAVPLTGQSLHKSPYVYRNPATATGTTNDAGRVVGQQRSSEERSLKNSMTQTEGNSEGNGEASLEVQKNQDEMIVKLLSLIDDCGTILDEVLSESRAEAQAVKEECMQVLEEMLEKSENDILEQEKIVNERVICVICMEEERRHLFVPCKHFVCCRDCSREVRGSTGLCPLCRMRIDRVEDVYW